MTVSNTVASVTIAGNGTQTTFAYNFEIPYQIDGETPAAEVYLVMNATGVGGLLDPSLYTITGVGATLGGTVIYPLTGSPVDAAHSLRINRALALIQPQQFLNQAFLPETVESGLDRTVLQLQQIAAEAANAALLAQDVSLGLASETIRAVAAESAISAVAHAAYDEANAAYALAEAASGGPIIAGTTMGTVLSVAALMAMAVTGLPANGVVNVKGYDSNGFGGGLFMWDPASTAPTDGGTVFCPNSLMSTTQSERVNYTDVAGFLVYKQLSQTDIVWDTFQMRYMNTLWLTAKWFSGNSIIVPRQYGELPLNKGALVNMKLGRVYGDGQDRVHQLCASNSADWSGDVTTSYTDVTYKYALGPGRWVRILAESVSPDMWGAVPNNPSFDCSFGSQAAFNYIGSVDPSKHYDASGGTYYFYGTPGEIPDACQFVDGWSWKFFGDQGGGAGGIIDQFSDAFLAGEGGDGIGPGNPYYLMAAYGGCAGTFDLANNVNLGTGWTIDGNLEGNLYARNASGWTLAKLQNYFRNSPLYNGLAMATNQSGRFIAPDAKWFFGSGTIKNMAGSMVFGFAKGYGDVLTLSSSAGNHLTYGGMGHINTLKLQGYCASSFNVMFDGAARVEVGQLTMNPWPELALSNYAAIGYRGEAREGNQQQSVFADMADGEYGNRYGDLTGLVDCCDVAFTEIYYISGETFRSSNYMIRGGQQRGTFRLFQRDTTSVISGDTTAVSGPYFTDGKIINRSTFGVTAYSDAVGDFEDVVLGPCEVVDWIAKPNMALYTHDLTHSATWALTGCTAQADQYNDPYNAMIIDRIKEDTSTGVHSASQLFSLTSGKYAVIWAHVQPDTRDWVWLEIGALGPVFFNPATLDFGYAPAACIDKGMIPVNFGDNRCLIFAVFEVTATASTACSWGVAANGASAGSTSYVGGGTSMYLGLGACGVAEYNVSQYARPGPDLVFTSTPDTGGKGMSQQARNDLQGSLLLVACAPATTPPVISTAQVVGWKDLSYHAWLGFFNSAESSSRNPMEILFEDCPMLRPTTNIWFRTDLTNDIHLATNLRIKLRNCTIQMYDPAVEGSTLTQFQNGIAKAVLENCRSDLGRVSEWGGMVTVAVVSGTPTAGQVQATAVNTAGYIDFATPLLATPMVYDALPVSANAVSVGVTSVATSLPGSDWRFPNIRVGVGTVTAGQTLTYRLSGAVAPAR